MRLTISKEATIVELPDVPNVRHRMVSANGTVLHVAEAGDDAAPAVLLLHGFPQHWYMWRDVMGPLAETRRVIALDFRGFGWSEAPGHGYSTATRVADVLAVLDESGVARADVVGHDWGALLGFLLARDHPDRVERLVALSMVHLWPMQRHLAPTAWRWWVTALFEWPGLGPWILRHRPQVTRWLLTRDSRTTWSESALSSYASVAAEPARAKAGQRLHMRLILDIPRLGRGDFHTPTLLVGGEQDSLIPPAVLTVPPRLRDTITVHTIPAGHYLVDENPQQVADLILGHISAQRAAEA